MTRIACATGLDFAASKLSFHPRQRELFLTRLIAQSIDAATSSSAASAASLATPGYTIRPFGQKLSRRTSSHRGRHGVDLNESSTWGPSTPKFANEGAAKYSANLDESVNSHWCGAGLTLIRIAADALISISQTQTLPVPQTLQSPAVLPK
jgi:hypothetical protein